MRTLTLFLAGLTIGLGLGVAGVVNQGMLGISLGVTAGVALATVIQQNMRPQG